MRRSLASFLVLVSTGALVVGLGGTASASSVTVSTDCVAVTEPPHLKPLTGTRLYSTGTFHCLAEATGMKVTVCIEEQYSPTAAWWSRGCTTNTDVESTSTISVTHSMSVPVYATFLRATVTGVNDRGETASFTTPPVWWFNCACYIG